jgi:hypothetical protein
MTMKNLFEWRGVSFARGKYLLPHICAFVASLAAGTYLPKNFQKRLAKMKTDL